MPAARCNISRSFFCFLFFALLYASALLPAAADDRVCVLYDRIKSANTDTAVGNCPAGTSHDIITITEDITLSEPLPPITGRITIEGGGHTISGDGKYRIFDVNGGQLTIKHLTLTKGRAPEAEYGGAIRLRNGAQVTVENSPLAENAAANGGGAIYADGGTLRINASDFDTNCVVGASHIVDENRSSADAARVEDNDGCLRVTYYWPSPEAMVATEQGDGGAISFANGAQVFIEHTAFSNNKATNGGAIANLSNSGGLTVTGSSFSGNLAEGSGGAIDTKGGATDITRSSFQNNKARAGGGVLKAGSGAAHFSNTTFYNNWAGHGGVAALEDGALVMTHVTMKDNGGSPTGGGAIANWGGIVKLRNSIIDGSGSHEDCVGALEQIAGTLSRDGTCGHFRSADPLLDDLTGEPAWHPLRDGSPAIDAADPEFCIQSDQIGMARPHGGGCDIGAIESTTAAPPIPEELEICPLPEQIVAANTDAPFGACPAGNGPDIFYLIRDIKLEAPLPQITSDITIEGNGYTLSGDGRFRIFDVKAGKLTINNLTLADGDAGPRSQEHGGAIRLRDAAQVVINDSTFRSNKAQSGGAIALEDRATQLIINRSQFVRNRAVFDGGALYAFNSGVITIENSSFVRNIVQRGDSTGGAISAQDATIVDISNSTFIRNVATMGGAISGGLPTNFYRSAVNLRLTHVTMLNNAGYGTGLYLAKNNQVPVRMLNSVIVGRGDTVHCHAQLAQNVGNFIADGTCSPQLSGDPMLEEATDSKAYVSPMPGSPLIGAADPRFCLRTDQNGSARSMTGRCDIGAIETIPASRPLFDCAVTTTTGLNFRDAPNGNRIGAVPVQATLTVLARTPHWIKVDHQGALGWISADYVTTQGNCD